MSAPAQNTSLSLSARLLLYLGPPSTVLLTAAVSPRTALLSPLAFLPTAWAYRKWRQENDSNPTPRAELEPMIWTFVSAGTLGLTAAALLQMGLVKVSNLVLFGSNKAMNEDFWKEFTRTTIDGLTSSELARRTELASSWQNWAFIGLFSFVGAGVVEEVLKYLPIVYARRRGTPKDRKLRNRAYIDYVMAGALSFSVVEAIGFIYAAGDQGREKWPRMTLTLLERIPGQVGHVAVALLTAVRALRRDYYGEPLSWWRVLGPAVLLHGSADGILFATSALGGNVGWIHPTGVWATVSMLGGYIGVVASILWQVKKGLKQLDDKDLAQKASINDIVKED